MPLLLVGSKGIDRVHHQAALDRGERADARVTPLELLHDQAIGHVVETGAAELLGEVGAEQAKLGHAGDELLRKPPLDVCLADHRDQVLIHPRPDGIADGALLLRQQAVEVEKVHAGELGCGGCRGHGIASLRVSNRR